jgi:SAM-dependent methyltransferase
VAPPDVLAEYYGCVEFQRWDYPGIHPTERRVLDTIRNLTPGSRIVDFGCSNGRFLSHCAKEYDCYGVEVNAMAAESAMARGIKIVDSQDLFDGVVSRFDAIILADVFEHLDSPTDLLLNLVSVLRPAGRLIVSTGNSDAPALRSDPSNCWYFRNIEHLCMLNPQHARYLSKQLGLSIESMDRECHYDVPLVRQMRTRATCFAYEVFHRGRMNWLRPALRFTPAFRKAQNWALPPANSVTADHLVIVFKLAG